VRARLVAHGASVYAAAPVHKPAFVVAQNNLVRACVKVIVADLAIVQSKHPFFTI